jgi:Tol biopolymer transport system component
LTLAAGTRLGPYEILSPLGAGGMGEVYRTKDTRLGREVAVKVLPAELAATAELKARFEREAKAISQLSHPHICALYDVGSSNGVEYLVMELLEGQTLAERLEKGPLPTEQVLKFGVEIADALDKAHRAGIVHRDLKPGNIMLTKSGVKLLDFGLARVVARGDDAGGLSSLPTEAERPLTEKGAILGTFQYMAPEQLEGNEADARTDIFALGCVIHEMATGAKAFSGVSRASLIGAIMSSQPAPISTVAPMSPPVLDRVVKTCLAKDPEDRWQSAHDVKTELQWIAEAGSQAGASALVVSRRMNRERLLWAVVTLGLLALAALPFLRLRARSPEPLPVRFNIGLPPGTAGQDFSVAPDGKRVAVAGIGSDGRTRLYVRSLDELESRAIPETDAAAQPFWSPDSRRIGFHVGGKLKSVEPAEGHPVELAEIGYGTAGMAWLADGRIVLGHYHGGLDQIPAGGGSLTPFVAGESLRYPLLLPDLRHVAFVARSLKSGVSSVDVVDIHGRDRRTLMPENSQVLSAGGYLLYGRDGALVARRFDAKRLTISGEPQTIQDPVETRYLFATVAASASDDVLVFKATVAPTTRLTWFDRSGNEQESVTSPGIFTHVDLASDGNLMALERLDPHTGLGEIWVGDLARGTLGRVVSGNEWDWMPVWSPDGMRLAYSSTRSHISDLYVKDEHGTGPDRLLYADSPRLAPEDWSRDGRTVVFQRLDQSRSRYSIWALSTTEERKPIMLTEGRRDVQARLSPDGRFLAFTSSEEDRPQIYVIPVPPTGARWQISTQGGFDARWRRDGKELYYLAPDRALMAVSVALDPTFRAGPPQRLFMTRVPDLNQNGRREYAPSPDGSRFLALTVTDPEWPPPITVVTQWTRALLKK